MKKNLHYFIYPIRGAIWRWNVEQIAPRLGIFDGRRIVVVARDKGTDRTDEVVRAFGTRIEVIEVENDPALGETASFLDVTGRLVSLDPEEATFYAHAKGVSRANTRWEKNVLAWAWAMYAINLGRPEAIECLLRRYSTVGCFKGESRFPGSSWCFRGSFFWYKHSALFSRQWRSINADRYGIEAYPGRHFQFKEAFNLTKGAQYKDLYCFRFPEEEVSRCLARMEITLNE